MSPQFGHDANPFHDSNVSTSRAVEEPDDGNLDSDSDFTPGSPTEYSDSVGAPSEGDGGNGDSGGDSDGGGDGGGGGDNGGGGSGNSGGAGSN
jgi:hypothetical protein